MCILEELDEQLNLTISFKNKTHILEGQFSDIIKAHNLILHQLELQKVTLPDESMAVSSMRSLNPSFLNGSVVNDESDSCRLSIHSSVISSADLTPRANGPDFVTRSKSSTPVPGNISQSHQGLYQEPKYQLPEWAREPTGNSMQMGRVTSSLSDIKMVIPPKHFHQKEAPDIPNADTFPLESGGNETRTIRKDVLRPEVSNHGIQNHVRKPSQESFASSMPSLERALSPGADNSYDRFNLQENESFTKRPVGHEQEIEKGDESLKIESDDESNTTTPKVSSPARKGDDIEALEKQLEKEYKNAKHQSSRSEPSWGNKMPDQGEEYQENLLPLKVHQEISEGDQKSSVSSSPDQRGHTSATAETEVKPEMTYVDTNTWQFMLKANKPELDNIKRKCRVSFIGGSDDSDLCCITITPESGDATVTMAMAEFTSLYERTMDECVQYPLHLASQIPEDKISRAVSRIKEVYPYLIVTPDFNNSRVLTFICRSSVIKEIADNFKQLIGMIPERSAPSHLMGKHGRESTLQYVSSERKRDTSSYASTLYYGQQFIDSEESDEEEIMIVKSNKKDKGARSSKDEEMISVENVKDTSRSQTSVAEKGKEDTDKPESKPISRPAFDEVKELKAAQLSKSQSPTLQLLYELLMKEDPSDEIQEMINKILSGEAVDDTGSGYFQDPGLFTGDPTAMDNQSQKVADKNDKGADTENESDDDEEDILYGNLKQSTGSIGRPDNKELKVGFAQNMRGNNEDISSDDDDDDDDDLYGNLKQSVGSTGIVDDNELMVGSAQVVRSTTEDASSDDTDNDLYVSSTQRNQEKIESPIGGNKVDSESLNTFATSLKEDSQTLRSKLTKPDDTEDSSSDDESDLYGEFKKSVSGIDKGGSFGFSSSSGPHRQTQVSNISESLVPQASGEARSSQQRQGGSNESAAAPSVVKPAGGNAGVTKRLPILPAKYQPKDGDMHLLIDKKYDIPGHSGQGAMVVTFNFEDAEQGVS